MISSVSWCVMMKYWWHFQQTGAAIGLSTLYFRIPYSIEYNNNSTPAICNPCHRTMTYAVFKMARIPKLKFLKSWFFILYISINVMAALSLFPNWILINAAIWTLTPTHTWTKVVLKQLTLTPNSSPCNGRDAHSGRCYTTIMLGAC